MCGWQRDTSIIGMAELTKSDVARRQLGTALALYLEGKDPVSVHVVACAGCELAEALVTKSGGKPFRSFTLASWPGMTDTEFTFLRTRFANAFKHSSTKKGMERNDAQILQEFSKKENEERLFVGWSDYSFSQAPMPVEAQVYVVWFMALDLSKFASNIDPCFIANLDKEFPNLRTLPPRGKKQSLLRSIERFRKDRRGKSDPLTDYSPLMLGGL